MRRQLAWVGLTASAFIAVYFGSFGGSGWHPTDYEYVMACAWRIVHGQIPYRDFIYHKTPLTPLIHSVWLLLPDGFAVRASRLFVYSQMALAGFLPIAWAVWRRFVSGGVRPLCLAVAGTAWALHNFPAMPWQTTDGVMFATLGILGLAESWVPAPLKWRVGARSVASAALTLALLAKQSFFGPFLLLACVSGFELIRGARRAKGEPGGLRTAVLLGVGSALPTLIVLLGLLGWLELSGAYRQFILQLSSQSTGMAFRDVGLGFPVALAWLVPVSASLPVLRPLVDGERGVQTWLARAVPMGLLAYLAVYTCLHPIFLYGRAGLGDVLFDVLVGTFLGRLVVAGLRRAGRAPWADLPGDAPAMTLLHAGFVLTAWACQFSLGYPTPILGVAGLGLVLHDLLPSPRKVPLEAAAAVLLAVVVFGTMWKVNDEAPYRDLPRSFATNDLGKVFPKLGGIRTSTQNFTRYAELKEIISRYALERDRPFVVLEDYPGASWLLGAHNPTGLDWWFPPEPEDFEERLFADLGRARPVAIVPKEPQARWGTYDDDYGRCAELTFRTHNIFAQAVVREWAPLGETRYFCAYAPK